VGTLQKVITLLEMNHTLQIVDVNSHQIDMSLFYTKYVLQVGFINSGNFTKSNNPP
jgi:hypothetical protein